MKRTGIVFVGLILILLISSCSTLPRTGMVSTFSTGAPQPGESVAVLIVPASMYDILSLDGNTIHIEETQYTVIYLEPGEHQLSFDFSYTEQTGTDESDITYIDASGTQKVIQSTKTKHYTTWTDPGQMVKGDVENGYLYTIRSTFTDDQGATVHWLDMVCPLEYQFPNDIRITMIPEDCSIDVDQGGKTKSYDLEIYTIGFSEKMQVLNFMRATHKYNFSTHNIWGWMILDGVCYDNMGNERFAESPYVFNSDETQWAIAEQVGFLGVSMTVTVNGEHGPLYTQVRSPFVSFDNPLTNILRNNNSLPYFDPQDRLIYRAQLSEGKWVVVFDGVKTPAFDDIYGARIDEDGNLYFTAVDRYSENGVRYSQFYRLTEYEVEEKELVKEE